METAGETVREEAPCLWPSESRKLPSPNCACDCFCISSHFFRFSASRRSCCSRKLSFAVLFAVPKLTKLLKLSAGGFDGGGLDPAVPDPWVDRGVFRPELNGEGARPQDRVEARTLLRRLLRRRSAARRPVEAREVVHGQTREMLKCCFGHKSSGHVFNSAKLMRQGRTVPCKGWSSAA